MENVLTTIKNWFFDAARARRERKILEKKVQILEQELSFKKYEVMIAKNHIAFFKQLGEGKGVRNE